MNKVSVLVALLLCTGLVAGEEKKQDIKAEQEAVQSGLLTNEEMDVLLSGVKKAAHDRKLGKYISNPDLDTGYKLLKDRAKSWTNVSFKKVLEQFAKVREVSDTFDGQLEQLIFDHMPPLIVSAKDPQEFWTRWNDYLGASKKIFVKASFDQPEMSTLEAYFDANSDKFKDNTSKAAFLGQGTAARVVDASVLLKYKADLLGEQPKNDKTARRR